MTRSYESKTSRVLVFTLSRRRAAANSRYLAFSVLRPRLLRFSNVI